MTQLISRSQLAELLRSNEKLRAALHIADSREQCNVLQRRVNVLIRRGRWRTEEETKLLQLFSTLIQDYKRHNPIAPEASTPI